MATVSITRKSEEYGTILARRDIIKADAVAALAAHGEDVRTQLNAIGGLSHHTRATRALAFAILSPQADFERNIRAVPVLIDALHNHANADVILSRLRAVGYTMTNTAKVAQYLASRALILDAAPSDVNYRNVLAHKGFGQKTASMAVALYDQHAPVITLDTWMLSGLLGVAATGKRKNANTYTAKGPAYDDIAAMMLEIAAELNVSPFLLQWSLWTFYRGTDTDNHLPIFGM